MRHDLEELNDHQLFLAIDAPLAALDESLVIRAANPRYLEVTGRERDELLGRPILEAFPDDPNDPTANGVASLRASFQEVFRHRRRDRMPIQRLDIPDPEAPGRFLRRFWALTNSPLHDTSGRVAGILHHVEDVTHVLDPILGERAQPREGLDDDAWRSLVGLLVHEALAHQQSRVKVGQLEHALTSRIVIEQAKGVVRASWQLSTEESFNTLRGWARSTRQRLEAVCAEVVTTLELPPPSVVNHRR